MRKGKPDPCPVCGADGVEIVTGEFTTEVEGADGRPMKVAVPNVTWRHCASCGEDLLDDSASKAISKAHRAALKLLPAEEIRALRQGLGKTQAQMSELLGIGEKTYSRWESGTHFQSEAFDRYLRLLQMPEVLARLNEIRLFKEGSADSPRFKFTYVQDLEVYDHISECNRRSAPACWFAA